MHLPQFIVDLALILGVAGATTLLCRFLKLPVVLGYVLSGIVVGPYLPTFSTVSDQESVKMWAEIGVIFLMFSLGLEFSLRKLMRVGPGATVTALVQIAALLFLGYAAGQMLGWERMDSLVLGGALAISSTMIIFKAFDDGGLKKRKFAQLVMGVLIIEDVAAILILVALSTMATSQLSANALLWTGLRLVVFASSCFLVGYLLIPTLFRKAGDRLNPETLTVVSIGLCLALSVGAQSLGFSAALGAFIMGSILAETRQAEKIEHLMMPLRDLFGAVFFVSVGMLVDPSMLVEHWGTILLISVVAVVGKTLAVAGGALLAGESLKVALPAGLAMGQIGEFSYIIANVGTSAGVTSKFLYPVIVCVSILTTLTTPPLISSSERISDFFASRLPRRFQALLDFHAQRVRTLQVDASQRSGLRLQMAKLILNGIVVTLVFGLSPRLIPTEIQAYLPVWSLSTLLAAPFIWGMFFALRDPSDDRRIYMPSLLGRLATVFWLGLLLEPHVDSPWIFFVAACGMTALFFTFYRRLETSYQWFESTIMRNLQQPKHRQESFEQAIPGLAPWEAHLSRIEVSGDSDFAGKSLDELRIRKDFGVTVAAIQRGRRMILPPVPETRLFPGDRILAMGSDEGLERFRVVAERNLPQDPAQDDLSQYALFQLLLQAEHPLLGQSLFESKLRERYGVLLVGLERKGERILSPDPEFRLQGGDLLWLVGDGKELQKLRAPVDAPPAAS
jgi:CPA2 family monovalent cation:H+ antiporter-2